jgi:UDPglucose--hexose-1-phosphate uridylyltransferase
MPDLRKDPIVGRWVIIAHERAKRPHDFRAEAPEVESPSTCPFCEGHEDKTPPEILAYRHFGSRPNGPGWRIRVVPNRFPALKVEGSLNKRGEGIYDMMAGIGAHEVIIESPDHHKSMASLPEENIREVLWAYRDRLVDLKKDERLVHGMLFKNVGAAAGASLEHTHSQLIVTPIVPISVWEEMTGSLEFYHYRGRCIYCDIVQQELAGEKRIVLDSHHFTAFCPFASRFPFETWIVPKTHSSHFENVPKPAVDDLGHVLHQVLNKLELALDSPAYNYSIHTAPFDHGALPHYHWHIEIIPRLTKVAGFEWGSGFYINPVPPENAAGFLRDVDVTAAIAGDDHEPGRLSTSGLHAAARSR